MLRLVMFDFDGVISDSEPAHYEVFRQVFEAEGIVVTWPLYCEKYLGYTDSEVAQHLLRDFTGAAPADRVAALAQKKKEAFARYMDDHCVILPGVADLLEGLRARGVHRSICSGALRSEIEHILDQAGLRDYFEVIVAADDVDAGKPDPTGYQLCLERTNARLGVTPPIAAHECVIIEDSLWGVEAAQRAGVFCLAVTTSYPADHLRSADHVIKDLSHIDIDNLARMVDNGA